MNSRNYRSLIYFFLAILGASLTIHANLEFIHDYGPGFDIKLFINLANANSASRSLSMDLLVGASAISIWIVTESKRLQMKNVWFVFLTMFTVAFAFAAPIFLLLRERRMLELEEQETI